MKYLISCLCIILSLSLNAQEFEPLINEPEGPQFDEFETREKWILISSELDTTIHVDSIVVQGFARTANAHKPINNVSIMANAKYYSSDSTGFFQFIAAGNSEDIIFGMRRWESIILNKEKFQKQHRITIEVFMTEKQIRLKKPVIYLYNDNPLKVELTIKPKGSFTFTYPQYTNGWDIRINEDKSLTDLKTEKVYPYLFWEAETNDLFFEYSEKNMEGFIVDTDSSIQFLETQLTAIGLNSAEQTDFITFWAPIMEQNKYAVVQFLIDDAYENKIAEMTIEPKPNAIRRVYILLAPLDAPYIGLEIVPQEFIPFTRKGFTVVEWGGSNLSFDSIKF